MINIDDIRQQAAENKLSLREIIKYANLFRIEDGIEPLKFSGFIYENITDNPGKSDNRQYNDVYMRNTEIKDDISDALSNRVEMSIDNNNYQKLTFGKKKVIFVRCPKIPRQKYAMHLTANSIWFIFNQHHDGICPVFLFIKGKSHECVETYITDKAFFNIPTNKLIFHGYAKNETFHKSIRTIFVDDIRTLLHLSQLSSLGTIALGITKGFWESCYATKEFAFDAQPCLEKFSATSTIALKRIDRDKLESEFCKTLETLFTHSA